MKRHFSNGEEDEMTKKQISEKIQKTRRDWKKFNNYSIFSLLSFTKISPKKEKPAILKIIDDDKVIHLTPESLNEKNDKEIMDLFGRFKGISEIWSETFPEMKEKYAVWDGDSKFLKIYHKAIIWENLSFKSKNFQNCGLDENAVLNVLLKTHKEIDHELLIFIWSFLC